MRERIQASAAAATGLKATLVGILVLVLLIPIEMIKDLRSEREATMENALAEIMAMAGGETILATPYLAIPTVRTERRLDAEGKPVDVTVQETWCVFPTRMNLSGEARVVERWRGIYAVPVHRSDFELDLEFEFRAEDAGVAGLRPDWSAVRLHFPYDDPRSLRESPVLTDKAGGKMELRSSQAPLDLTERAVSVPVKLTFDPSAEISRFACRLDIPFSGARSVSFLPLADVNNIKLSGDWPSPSFSGYRLPVDRRYSDSGFQAAWFVDESGRTIPRVLEAAAFQKESARSGAFGVGFYKPTNLYQRVYRALRYAVLFLVIPFAALFLLETLSRRRVHPVQYLLVGLANCVFYLLLLAAAEHLPFLAAYLGAAAAVSVTTAIYVGAILPVRWTGLAAFFLLALQYGYLYAALDSEDYALLIGSVGLFLILAVAMAATRKIDWYGNAAPAATGEVTSAPASSGGPAE